MRTRLSGLVLSVSLLAPGAFVLGAGADQGGSPTLSEETVRGAVQSAAPLRERAGSRWKAGPEYDGRYWVVIRATTKEQRTALAGLGLSIEEVHPDRVAGTAHIKDIEAMKARGFVVDEMVALGDLAEKGFPPKDEAYHDYGEMAALMGELAAKNPGLVSMFSAGKTWQDREIWVLRFNSSASGLRPSSKPGALLMGTHHAREHLTTEVPLLFAVHLSDNKNKPEVKKLLDSRDIHIIPMINPDGVEYDVATSQYRWQRKNMRVNPDGEIGVDLNRNYGYEWGGVGASDQPYSDTYHGPSAFSEPETAAIKRFVEARPNIKTSISYHSYGSLIFYPWSYSYDPIPNKKDLAAFKAAAAKMASLTGYTAEQSSDLYASSGDTDDWMYGVRRVFGFTYELEGGSFYPGSAAIAPAVKKNTAAALYLIGIADDIYQASGSEAGAGR
ncbi:MAG: zinc carboxypeptidase [Elusimicrobia bacterium]|nr:zinc carboxypeptidase [Elusimicrobiota bacterium]